MKITYDKLNHRALLIRQKVDTTSTIIYELFNNFIALAAEASPWLLLGLLIAGLMKAWVPSQLLSKHLGQGKMAIVKAAIFGAPLPLCSCGVIPVATELKRSGASNAATSAFLVATPETGVDSVSVSYALLGPVFAIYRPIVAILSAIFTGALVATISSKEAVKSEQKAKTTSCCSTNSCESTNTNQQIPVVKESIDTKSCCAHEHEHNDITPSKISQGSKKTLAGIKYALTQLIDDIIIWLFIGLVFATLVRTFIPETFLTSYGSGLPAMLVMIAISIPMYICATASTPVAAGFLMAGISPGTALVFMMAGPATNISTLGVIKNEMGSAVLIRYLIGISTSAILFGLLLDWGIAWFAIDMTEQLQHNHELLPLWFGYACALIILFSSVKPLRNKLYT